MKLNSFDAACIELLERAPNRFSKHCFRSAINHLQYAERLLSIDSVMAAFRCYTAEEEAASGLMQCLKESAYEGANLLKPRDHFQKNAFIPFFSMLNKFVDENMHGMLIHVDLLLQENNQTKYLTTEVLLRASGKELKINPHPPFNFNFFVDGDRASYGAELEKLARTKGERTIEDHLAKQANKRNQLLYAKPEGFPSRIEITDKFLPAYERRVISMLRAYLMIFPYKEKQLFVQDCLNSFLEMLSKFESKRRLFRQR